MLLTLPEQIARFKKMNPHLASTYNRVGWPTYVDQTPAAPPERPVYAITVGDEDAARAIDPCWATIFALWASPAGPFEIRVGDVLVATIAPTDAGVALRHPLISRVPRERRTS